MTIDEKLIKDFRILTQAAQSGNIGLLECTEKATGKTVALLMLCWRDVLGEECSVPIAVMGDRDELMTNYEPPDGTTVRHEQPVPSIIDVPVPE